MRRSDSYTNETRYDLYILTIECPYCTKSRVYRFIKEIPEYGVCKCCNKDFMIGYNGDEEWDYDSIKIGYEVVVEFESINELSKVEVPSEYYERDQPLQFDKMNGVVLDMGMEKYGHFLTALIDFGGSKAWIDTRDLKIDRVRNKDKWY